MVKNIFRAHFDVLSVRILQILCSTLVQLSLSSASCLMT
uniref:Uncharacterized protein n=1 Tax=Anguilla anguilla TaxID=7936 RepID=A0A0E9QQC4_ANGAN